MRSRLIVNPTKSSSWPIDIVTYYFLIHSIPFINLGLSSIPSMPSTYTMIITVPISFHLYKIQVLVLHCFNIALRVIVLVYSLKKQHSSCMILYIDFISINIYSYVKCYSINPSIPSGVFVYIYSSSNFYWNSSSESIVWESHSFINHIIIMIRSLMSVTTDE